MAVLPDIWRSVVVSLATIGLVSGMVVPGMAAHAAAVPGAVEVPIRVQAGHVSVDVEINGEGPFHLLFDTGATNVLTPDAAKRLRLPVRGNVEATGTGGAQAAGSTRVDTVRIGGVEMANQTFYVLDLPPGTSDDAPVDGLIGFEWLARFPARLDYAGGTLTLYTGKDTGAPGPGAATRLSFRGRTPQIDGEVDGIAGRFSIDTGSTGSLTLSSPFVADHDLVTRYDAETRVMSARGIGGPAYALLARAGRLDLGSAAVEGPVTFLSQQTTGTYARKDTAGNIGYGVLRKFTIFFDYPRKQIHFTPNAEWGAPDLADRSGLRLERDREAFSVAFVAEGSPAATAGLRAGDRITAVNAGPSAGLALEAVRTLLKGPIGTQVAMASDRGPITIVLADL